MKVKINGKELTIDKTVNIMEFLTEKGFDPNSVVVEYNYEIVKKEAWSNITLKENDTLEILRFVGGG